MERITAGTLVYIRKFKGGILYFTCRAAVKYICYGELEALPSRQIKNITEYLHRKKVKRISREYSNKNTDIEIHKHRENRHNISLVPICMALL